MHGFYNKKKRLPAAALESHHSACSPALHFMFTSEILKPPQMRELVLLRKVRAFKMMKKNNKNKTKQTQMSTLHNFSNIQVNLIIKKRWEKVGVSVRFFQLNRIRNFYFHRENIVEGRVARRRERLTSDLVWKCVFILLQLVMP